MKFNYLLEDFTLMSNICSIRKRKNSISHLYLRLFQSNAKEMYEGVHEIQESYAKTVKRCSSYMNLSLQCT
jgi:hypothetical protein